MAKPSKSADPVVTLHRDGVNAVAEIEAPATGIPLIELRPTNDADREFVRKDLRASMERGSFSWLLERALWASMVATNAAAGVISGYAWYGWQLTDRMFRLEMADAGRRATRLTVVR